MPVGSGVGAGALLGVATIPVLGPAGPLLGAAVGAYTGSLVGALGGMDNVDPQDPAQPQHAGVVLAALRWRLMRRNPPR